MSESPPSSKASPASGPSLKAHAPADVVKNIEKTADAALQIIEPTKPAASLEVVGGDGDKEAKVGLGEAAGDEKDNQEALKALMDAKDKIDRELVKLPDSASDLWEQFWEKLFNRLMEGRFNLFQITRDHQNKIIKFLGGGFPGMLAEKIAPYVKKLSEKKSGHTPAEGDAEKTDPNANHGVPSVNAANTVDPKLAEQLHEAAHTYAEGKQSGGGNNRPSETFTPGYANGSGAKASDSAAKSPDVPAAKPEPDKPVAAPPKSR